MLSAKYPYIFIITYGRSGSTLLQGILNTIPGYCIRGENNGVVNYLRKSSQRLSEAHQKFSQIGITPADSWYGIDLFQRKTYLKAIGELIVKEVLRPPKDTRCTGFKEIRYTRNMVGDLGAHINFMRQVFPGAGFVFNSRNLDDVVKSGWWKDHANPREHLEDFEANMKTAFERHAEYSIWIRYDDYIVDPGTLSALFDFLKEPFDLEGVQNTLSLKHSG